MIGKRFPAVDFFARYRTPVFLALLMLTGAALRWPRLSHYDLWFDELFSTRLFLGDPANFLATLTISDRLPLHYALLYGWIRLFGDSELSVRLPSFLAAIASIGLLFPVARRAAGARAGWLAVFFLTISPVHIWFSAESRPYSLMVFCTLVMLYAIFRWSEAENDRGIWTALTGVSTCALSLLHYYASAVILAVSAAVFILERRGRRGLLLVQALAMVPFFIFIFGRSWLCGSASVPAGDQLEWLRAFTPAEAPVLFFNWFFLGNSLKGMDAVHVFGFAVFACGILATVRPGDRSRAFAGRIVFAAFLSVPVALYAAQLAGGKHTYVNRSAITSLPLFFVIMAAGIDSLSRQKGRMGKALGSALTAFVILLQVIVLGQFLQNADRVRTVREPNPAWKKATQFLTRDLERSGREGKSCLVLSTYRCTEMSYYNRDFTDSVYLRQIRTAAPKVRQLMASLRPWTGEKIVRMIDRQLRSAAKIKGKTVIYGGPVPGEILRKAGIDRVYIVQGPRWVDQAVRKKRIMTQRFKFTHSASVDIDRIVIHRLDRKADLSEQSR